MRENVYESTTPTRIQMKCNQTREFTQRQNPTIAQQQQQTVEMCTTRNTNAVHKNTARKTEDKLIKIST